MTELEEVIAQVRGEIRNWMENREYMPHSEQTRLENMLQLSVDKANEFPREKRIALARDLGLDFPPDDEVLTVTYELNFVDDAFAIAANIVLFRSVEKINIVSEIGNHNERN